MGGTKYFESKSEDGGLISIDVHLSTKIGHETKKIRHKN